MGPSWLFSVYSKSMDKEKLSRRDFFRKGLRSLVEGISEIFGEAPDQEIQRLMSFLPESSLPLRPPGALPEALFLQRCTGCGACQTACPYEAIRMVGGTPVIYPEQSPCHFCPDFPCIQSCEPEALSPESRYLKMGQAVLFPERCLAHQGVFCITCQSQCPAEAIDLKPQGGIEVLKDRCVGCGLCVYACPQSPPALRILP